MANEYFEEKHNLDRQRSWYSGKASKNKKYCQWLGLAVILAGASTSFVQVWADSPTTVSVNWVAIVTALLGVTVVVAKGIERIWDFDGTWLGYRKASEAMKREKRLFVNSAMVYAEYPDNRKAFLLFIERVESIIAEEKDDFWKKRDSSG
jgi:hypothetical protein